MYIHMHQHMQAGSTCSPLSGLRGQYVLVAPEPLHICTPAMLPAQATAQRIYWLTHGSDVDGARHGRVVAVREECGAGGLIQLLAHARAGGRRAVQQPAAPQQHTGGTWADAICADGMGLLAGGRGTRRYKAATQAPASARAKCTPHAAAPFALRSVRSWGNGRIGARARGGTPAPPPPPSPPWWLRCVQGLRKVRRLPRPTSSQTPPRVPPRRWWTGAA